MHIMIDIETWDTAPTAIVRAIALIAFEENGEILGKCLIDARETVDEQLEQGRTDGAGTVDWWPCPVPLSEHIYRHLDKDLVCARNIEQVLEEIEAFIRRAPQAGGERIWSRGHFDMPILRNLFYTQDEYGEAPWPYYLEADVRTLDVLTDKVAAEQPHDPISDAEAQVKQVVNALALRTTHPTRRRSHDQVA